MCFLQYNEVQLTWLGVLMSRPAQVHLTVRLRRSTGFTIATSINSSVDHLPFGRKTALSGTHPLLNGWLVDGFALNI